MSHERTFAKDVADPEELETRLMMLAVDTGASLRADDLRGRTVTVRVRYGDFTDKSASRTVPEPIESDRAIFTVARELLRGLLAKRGGGVRLLGVGISKLVGEDDEDEELVLFDEPPDGPETARDRKIAEASDRLRGKFGKEAIVPARIVNRNVQRRPPRPRRIAGIGRDRGVGAGWRALSHGPAGANKFAATTTRSPPARTGPGRESATRKAACCRPTPQFSPSLREAGEGAGGHRR